MSLIYENVVNELKVADNGLLSKIQIGGKTYEVKDLVAREKLSALRDAALQDVAAGISGDGLVKAADVKAYVDAQVGAINSFDVAIVNELPVASQDTMYILYLVANTDASSGEYIEYITIRSGVEGAYTYSMEPIGSTKMDVTGFVTEEALAEALKPYELKANLKALAYKDSANGIVAGETISGVKATGTSAGSINVELQATEKAVTSTGKFTPAGNVSGTVKAAGNVSVTVSNAAADATLTKGDYTPAGTVNVALSGDSFNKITGVGTQATFTEGTFTPATLIREEVTANYAKEGIVGSVDGETLTFTAAGIEALSASKITSFDGGAKAADVFVANSLPTMEAHTVGVQSASFSGTLAEDLVVTKVSYAKANAEAAATFEGATSNISATFAGTEADVSVSGNCHDYSVKTAEFTGQNIELSVGDIVVAEKAVSVQ